MGSPLGELRLTAVDGLLTAIDFVGDPPVEPGQAPGSGAPQGSSAARAAARAQAEPDGERVDDDWLLSEAVSQLVAYFRRDLKEFDLPLGPRGTAFQLKVWSCLHDIGYGEVSTYGAVAGRLGMSGLAARAVGLASGRNPVPVVVPCHRLVSSSGALTGYAGGISRKRYLLKLEREVPL